MATATFTPSITNNMSQAQGIIGRVTKGGVRYNAGENGHQPVLNVKLAFRRSWQDKNTNEWMEKNSYITFALWGEQGTRTYEKLTKIGVEGMDIRVTPSFSMADVDGRIWKDKDGKDRVELTARANSLEIVGAYPFSNGNGSSMPAGTMVEAPAELEEVEI